MKFLKIPQDPARETFEGVPVIACYVSEDDIYSIPVIEVGEAKEEWNAGCRASAIKHLRAAGIAPTDEHIDAYHAFLCTDYARCGGELFNERLREGLLA